MRRILWLYCLALCLALPAFAAEINVDTTEDGADSDLIDDICNDGLGNCTLRAAIQTANALGGSNDVMLPAGLYSLSLKRDSDLPDGVTGDLDVDSDITVIGAGAGTPCEGVGCSCIDGKKGKDRIFDVAEGGKLRLEQLIVKNGGAPKDDFNPVQSGQISGGCIRVAGELETEDVVIERCKSPDDGGCIGFVDFSVGSLHSTFVDACKAKDGGGGIEVDFATFEADRVTIAHSKASEGGAIETSGGTLDLKNLTASTNKAKVGGGLSAEFGATVEINNASFVNNKAKAGAAVNNDNSFVELSNSLLRTQSKENNCTGVITSDGGNLENGTDCGFSFGGGDCPDCNPGIDDDLADNGGPVPTHAIDGGSEAINNGIDMTCETTDARGAPRVGGCDSGSYEFGGLVP